MSEELWTWKNNKNPSGNLFSILMKDKDKLIAYYSVAPKEFYILGQKFQCVQSIDTMADLDYRGHGFSTFIGELTYEYVKMKGFNFVYGFPNEVSQYLFETKLGWTNFGKLKLFIKKINSNIKLIKVLNRYLIKEIDFFGKEINDFWDKYKNNFPIIIKKDMDYLNWRFVEHPLVKYKKFLIIDEDIDKIIAYFILKRYKDKEGNLTGHIVDFLIGPYDKILKQNVFKLIENYSVNEFKEDCSQISFWMPDEDLKELALKKLGYNLTQIETYFGYKIFKYSQQLDILKSWKN